MNSDFNKFYDSLSKIKWFLNVGKPIEYLYLISDWDTWVGPEHFACGPIGLWQQELYDSIIEYHEDKEPIQIKWDNILDKVLEDAKDALPFDCDGDPWDPPSYAIWQAAWTAALYGIHINLDLQPPKDLETQWKWFVQGRWPCSYAMRTPKEQKQFKQWYSDGSEESFVKIFEDTPNEFVVF